MRTVTEHDITVRHSQ